MSKDRFDLPENLTQNTRDAWRAAVEQSLGGKSLEAALSSKTYDGIAIKPLYDQNDLAERPMAPLTRQRAEKNGARPWDILQLIDIPNITAANQQIKTEFEGGASGLYLSISTDIPYAASSLLLRGGKDIAALFNGIDLEGKTLYLANGYEGLAVAAALISYLEETGLKTLNGSLGFDPLALFAAMGSFPDPAEDAFANWVDAAHAISQTGLNIKPFRAGGHVWQQAGASEAMELGFTLASALSYVRALEASGFSKENAFNAVDLSLMATGDIFLTLAKCRAMRLLWGKICEAAGVSPGTKLMAKMSYLDLAMKDPETNMLRATAATVAASLGTVDALVLLPFTSAHGLAAPGARRLALNTQIIAQEESHLGEVQDPAAGSYYIECLTHELAEKGWGYFQQTEKAGGMARMLRSGAIRKLIEPVSNAREEDISTAKTTITGLNSFPNLNEKPPELMEITLEGDVGLSPAELLNGDVTTLSAPGKGARFNDLKQKICDGFSFLEVEAGLEMPQTLITMIGNLTSRHGTNIEQLRTVSDYIKVETGKRPSVFLANLGKPSAFTARATWAKSYFETGGIEAVSNDGFKNEDEMIAAFKASGAQIACLCSNDETYEEAAVKTAKQLKEAGANGVYLVARPTFLAKVPIAERGVFHALLYQGTDMILTLMEAHYLIGIDDETLEV